MTSLFTLYLSESSSLKTLHNGIFRGLNTNDFIEIYLRKSGIETVESQVFTGKKKGII